MDRFRQASFVGGGVKLASSATKRNPRCWHEGCGSFFCYVPKRLAFRLVHELSWEKDEHDNKGKLVLGLASCET